MIKAIPRHGQPMDDSLMQSWAYSYPLTVYSPGLLSGKHVSFDCFEIQAFMYVLTSDRTGPRRTKVPFLTPTATMQA